MFAQPENKFSFLRGEVKKKMRSIVLSAYDIDPKDCKQMVAYWLHRRRYLFPIIEKDGKVCFLLLWLLTHLITAITRVFLIVVAPSNTQVSSKGLPPTTFLVPTHRSLKTLMRKTVVISMTPPVLCYVLRLWSAWSLLL